MTPHRSAILAILMLLSLAAVPSAVSAPVRNEWITVTDDFDSCSGERVVVTLDQHIVEQVIPDDSIQEHVVSHRNVHGMGVGTVSGATYVLVDTYAKVDRTETVVGDSTIVTEVYEMAFIRQGETTPDDDTFARMITRTTIAPDGTWTVEIDLDSFCR